MRVVYVGVCVALCVCVSECVCVCRDCANVYVCKRGRIRVCAYTRKKKKSGMEQELAVQAAPIHL